MPSQDFTWLMLFVAGLLLQGRGRGHELFRDEVYTLARIVWVGGKGEGS